MQETTNSCKGRGLLFLIGCDQQISGAHARGYFIFMTVQFLYPLRYDAQTRRFQFDSQTDTDSRSCCVTNTFLSTLARSLLPQNTQKWMSKENALYLTYIRRRGAQGGKQAWSGIRRTRYFSRGSSMCQNTTCLLKNKTRNEKDTR